MAQCRISSISNGNTLVQSLLLVSSPMEEQHIFSNSILYFHIWSLGDGKLPKTTAEYLLLSSSPSRWKAPRPVESTLWLFTCSQCLLPTASLASSLCRQPGRAGIHHCRARSPSSGLLVSSSHHSNCSSAQAALSQFSFFIYAGKEKKKK